MADKSWRDEAQRRWGTKAKQIKGDGQYACVASCANVLVTLCPTRAKAEEQKRIWDFTECGAGCNLDHQVFDLSIAEPSK